MKVKLSTYTYEASGIALQMVPETELEERLLSTIWKHGRLETGHPCRVKIGGTGYYIQAFEQRPKEE